MLLISRKKGESVIIGGNIEITVLEIHGDKIKIGIDAPKEIGIVRKELKELESYNQEANSIAEINSVKSLIESIKKIK